MAALIADRVPDGELRGQAAAWLSAGARYHDLIRLCACAVVAMDAPGDRARAVYRPKAASEVEPMLALWPHVLVLPTTALLSMRDLIQLRAFPVHPLGVVAQPLWVDGGRASPSEYFFHDLDHARFKVREDLLTAGISIPDAYQDGSTLDPRTGRHRTILPFAVGEVGVWCGGGPSSAGATWARS